MRRNPIWIAIAGMLESGPAIGDTGRMSDYERHRRMRDYYTEREADFSDWVSFRPDIYNSDPDAPRRLRIRLLSSVPDW